MKIQASSKSQTEIAKEIGYPNPNVITMFKQGRTKVPVTKVPELAKALEMDPILLMKIVMTEYSPETWKVIENLLDKNYVTEAEMKVVHAMREVAGDVEVCPTNKVQLDEFKGLIETWHKSSTAKVIKH